MTGVQQMIRAAFAGLLAIAISVPAMAETRWQRTHPRRDQVNGRLARQNARIRQERRAGDLSAAQAKALHHEDHQIRRGERGMARLNGTHITRAEQRALNQQEDAVSRQIGR